MQFSSSQTSSIRRSVPARLSDCRYAVSVSVPCAEAFGASLLPSPEKPSALCSSWFFCRCPLMSCAAYFPFLYSLVGTVWAFDPRSRLGLSCRSASILSHDFVTRRRSPEVSSTAFDAQPPDLPPVRLMDMGFAVMRPLACHRRPRILFLLIGSRLCSALLSGSALRRMLFNPCASLSLRVYHVVKRTYTSQLSNMLGTRKKGEPEGPPE